MTMTRQFKRVIQRQRAIHIPGGSTIPVPGCLNNSFNSIIKAAAGIDVAAFRLFEKVGNTPLNLDNLIIEFIIRNMPVMPSAVSGDFKVPVNIFHLGQIKMFNCEILIHPIVAEAAFIFSDDKIESGFGSMLPKHLNQEDIIDRAVIPALHNFHHRPPQSIDISGNKLTENFNLNIPARFGIVYTVAEKIRIMPHGRVKIDHRKPQLLRNF